MTETPQSTPCINTPPATPAATAGGDHRVQLKHLKLHRWFQSQTQHTFLKLNWNTTITREESRRHITREIHAKINSKAPRLFNTGKLDTPEGQQHLQDFARRLNNRERISPGDGYKLNWNLRYRAIRSMYPALTEEMFVDLMKNDFPGNIQPKERTFPPHVLTAMRHTHRLKELLSKQGISPKRHRAFIICQALRCRQCRNTHAESQVQDNKCPNCQHRLTIEDSIDLACKPDSPYAA